MIKPVIDKKGIVDKIIGDAVMAIFGLSSDEGDDYKERAIATGTEMIKRISEITADSGDNASVMGLGVGIASGDVVVGILGNERRRCLLSSDIGSILPLVSKVRRVPVNC